VNELFSKDQACDAYTVANMGKPLVPGLPLPATTDGFVWDTPPQIGLPDLTGYWVPVENAEEIPSYSDAAASDQAMCLELTYDVVVEMQEGRTEGPITMWRTADNGFSGTTTCVVGN